MNLQSLLSGPGKPGVLASEVWLAAAACYWIAEDGVTTEEMPWLAAIVVAVLTSRTVTNILRAAGQRQPPEPTPDPKAEPATLLARGQTLDDHFQPIRSPFAEDGISEPLMARIRRLEERVQASPDGEAQK